ncbi:hypothetical protein P12x_003083 [Tundrisphaera lichenicola]|uniref:hypothetical protein n=1 Tax=Tundrisphaera lichenicola TaxID=2029860 RepID=UPI003EBD7B1C
MPEPMAGPDGPENPRIVDTMNAKLKPILIALGAIAALLIVTQLVMGLMIVRGGGSMDLTKLVKAHQHSGYLTVTVVILYIGLSLSAIASIPGRPRG